VKIVTGVTCLSIGAVSIVHPNTIQCSIHRAAAACSKSANIIADKLFAICVTVVDRIKEEITNYIFLKCVVIGCASVSRCALLIDDTKGWARAI
jgi:ABC-type polysaccharide/polyol phosphate export permease